MRDRTTQNRITVVLGILLTFAMLASTMLGLLRNFGQNTAAPEDIFTPTPAPTVPAPIEDLDSIQFPITYLHPSGLFTAAIPTGWVPANEINAGGEARVSLQNPGALSVVELRVTQPSEDKDISTADGVSAIFTDSWLDASWREYTTWNESSRRVEDDRVIIDFSLTRSGQSYIARQISFADETWIYTVRMVTPSNASRVLQYVIENEAASFQPVAQFVGAPIDWNANYDRTSNHLIRYPGTWTITDSIEGGPVSISGDHGEMRVEVLDSTIDSEDAASEYVESLRSGVSVTSIEAIEQYGASGYSVAYEFTTLDGDSQSGILYLLNGESGTHSANVLLSDVSNTDLNNVDLEAEDTPQSIVNALEALRTFSVAPDLPLQIQ